MAKILLVLYLKKLVDLLLQTKAKKKIKDLFGRLQKFDLKAPTF